MRKQLFFDDNKLYSSDNIVRKYGKAEVVAEYDDGVCSTDFYTGHVFRLDNGKFRMIYFGHSEKFQGKKAFSAISDDGINFVAENVSGIREEAGQEYIHEIMPIDDVSEIAEIIEDKNSKNPDERYKLLMSELDRGELKVSDVIYTSSDLINWQRCEDAFWGSGGEPVASVFYNNHSKAYTILERPFWGRRCVGYIETTDWKKFSEYQYCLNVDSNDECLSEIYGMFAFEYDGMYIGLPHIYRNLHSELNTKYDNGIIDTQIAYSFDGHYWQRSLREPFISGTTEKLYKNANYNMVWISSMLRGNDGSIMLYGSASEHEHGPAFRQPGTGKIFIYMLRKDGFISLSSKEKGKQAVIATREKLWHGGELHLNLKSKHATVAVYISDESVLVTGNVLGFARPLEGYGHDDCVSFSGDSTDWVPKFRSGKTIDELSGQTIVFELRFTDGEVFSLSGDYTDLFNTQAAAYRKFGRVPE